MRFAQRAIVGLVCVALLALAPAGTRAQESKLEVRDGDTVKAVLQRHVGKRVALVLPSGPELTGVVTRVGDHVVHLSEIGGRDYFDAIVALDRISAVVVRVRGR